LLVLNETPFAEFAWADFFRVRIDKKSLRRNFYKTVKRCIALAHSSEAATLPGFLEERGDTHSTP
jgi:hypothetical protein